MADFEELKQRFNDPLITAYIILGLLPFFSVFIPATDTLFFLEWFYLLSGIGCAYWCIRNKSNYRNIVPILLVLCISFVYFDNASSGYQFWPYPFAFALIASALWVAGMNVEVAFILAIIFSGAMIHMVPALLTDYLEEIDPYYHYKWAQTMNDTGKLPVHDWLTYPKIGGLDRADMPLGMSFSIASFGHILQLIGYSLHDAAMLIPVIAAVITLIVAYVVVKEAYWKHPAAKYAAMFAVFVLMLQIGWSTKAHATDCEDDVMGGLGILASMMFYLMAINRDDVRMSLVGSFVFGWLITVYDGQRLLMMVIFMAIVCMAIVGILRNKKAYIYIKHFGIIWVLGQIFGRLALHLGTGFGFGTFMPTKIEIAVIILAVGAVAMNELYVRYKKLTIKQLVILAAIGLIVCGPYIWAQLYDVAVTQGRQSTVVFKTIAEQAPFATSISGYINAITSVYGVAGLLSVLAILGLSYLGWKEYNFNYILFAIWQAVATWGLYFKSQYMFAASIPFAIVGSFFALYVIKEKKDLEGFAVLPTLIIIGTALLYTPMATVLFKYDSTAIFFNVADYSRIGWEPALQFFKNQSANTAVVTWWDYGHWLTSVSHKFVLIDNLQHDHWEIQDVAKFFMKETNEESATNILRDYQKVYSNGPYKEMFGGVNLRYVAIDWTMIGKSGAMRFIATGNLTNQADGEYDTYIQCGFMPQYSNVNGTMITNADGTFAVTKTLIYGCQQNKDNLNGIMFELTGDKMSAYAIDSSGGRIGWSTWIKIHNSSLFGVKSPQDILSVCIQYAGSIDRISPTYTNFVYGNGDFKNLMLARLYFGDYIDRYKEAGLADVDWSALRYYKKIKETENGFVDIWEISPEAYSGINGYVLPKDEQIVAVDNTKNNTFAW